MYKCLKLVTGEEIIGEVVSENTNTIELSSPCRIASGYGTDGYYEVKIMPFMGYLQEKVFTFVTSNIILSLDLVDSSEVIGFYKKFANDEGADEDYTPAIGRVIN